MPWIRTGTIRHLLRQMTLVHNAQITTIHSFCMNVIRNHFHEIDLDPGFRIVDEGENRLLMADTMDALMKRHYEEEAEGSIFFSLVDAYGKRGRDTSVTEMILDLYEKAQSYPWPGEVVKEHGGVLPGGHGGGAGRDSLDGVCPLLREEQDRGCQGTDGRTGKALSAPRGAGLLSGQPHSGSGDL